MVNFWGTIFTIALGCFGWVVTSFFARPYMQFHDLRGDVIQKSVLYANVSASAKQHESGYRSHEELTEPELDRLRKAEEEFRNLAARMRAFALNEPPTMWFVKLWHHYDPLEASAALLAVSNTLHAYGLDRANAQAKLEQVLRFRTII